MNIENNLYDNYGIKIKTTSPITDKTFKIICNKNNCFFVKQVTEEIENKYNFLANQGVSNILYPMINYQKKYVSNFNNKNYYLNDYIENFVTIPDSQVYNMFNALNRLHESTVIKRQLSVSHSRPKFEELTKQLDYKFKLLENFVRSLETRMISKNSLIVLQQYHIILDAKNELIRLQKRIIMSIKDKESVEYVFVHNNPKIDHVIMNRGSTYLTSIENGKIGIDSIDLAKFYVENKDSNLDFKKMIFDDYYSHKGGFYYDYFRFLVLFIYIKSINITNIEYFNLNNFVHICNNISNFLETFLDKKEEIQ